MLSLQPLRPRMADHKVLMPVRDQAKGGAPRKYSDRLVLDAIFFVLRSGCQWRMIPADLAPWDAAYRWYRTWVAGGTIDRGHQALHEQVRTNDGARPRCWMPSRSSPARAASTRARRPPDANAT